MDANPQHKQMVEFTLDLIPEKLMCGLGGDTKYIVILHSLHKLLDALPASVSDPRLEGSST